MSKREIFWTLFGVVLCGLVFVAFYLWKGDASDRYSKSFPTKPDINVLSPPKPPRYVFPDLPAIGKAISTGVSQALPVDFVKVEVEQAQAADAAGKIDTIVNNLAFPLMHGRRFGGIVSLTQRCAPREPCGTRVLAPNQINWTSDDETEFKNRARTLLTAHTPPITDADLLFRVTWTTTGGERFTTYLVTTTDHKPVFEPMLYFSPAQKKCNERSPSRGPQDATLEWDGDVRNGLGWQVITWRGAVRYEFQNGRLLTTDPCPGKTCLTTTAQPLWFVDDDATTVTAGAIQRQRSPEEIMLGYRLIWYVGLPRKITVGNFSTELPAPKGNTIGGSFTLRADGTWEKIN